MISYKYVGSLAVVMLLTFSVMAQSTNGKKAIKKPAVVEIQPNIIKSITYSTKPLINKKMITIQPDSQIKGEDSKIKSEENKKSKSKAIKEQ